MYNDLETFNRERNNNSNQILNLNIRNLNANFEKLQLLIESFRIKPYVIVYTEVWKLRYYQYYKSKAIIYIIIMEILIKMMGLWSI